jgi:SHS2 domain-containing protein
MGVISVTCGARRATHMYEIIDHTADIGIHAAGKDLKEVFIRAAEGMFDVMVESRANLLPAITVPVHIKTGDSSKTGLGPHENLFVKWLQELLYIFETRHIVPTHFFIDEVSDNELEGCVKGLKFDSTRHHLKCQIKAVTYHKLSVEKKPDGWHATVIFDI